MASAKSSSLVRLMNSSSDVLWMIVRSQDRSEEDSHLPVDPTEVSGFDEAPGVPPGVGSGRERPSGLLRTRPGLHPQRSIEDTLRSNVFISLVHFIEPASPLIGPDRSAGPAITCRSLQPLKRP